MYTYWCSTPVHFIESLSFKEGSFSPKNWKEKNDFMHLYSKVRKTWNRKRSLMWFVLVESSQRRTRKETEPKGIIGSLREAYDLRIDLQFPGNLALEYLEICPIKMCVMAQSIQSDTSSVQHITNN